MVNKQVKSSERERESNNYTRATPIDLKTIDSEVASIAGRATQVPIDMQSLWNEVQNLKNKNVNVSIKTFSVTNKSYSYNAGASCVGAVMSGLAKKSSTSDTYKLIYSTSFAKKGNTGTIGGAFSGTMTVSTSGTVTVNELRAGNYGVEINTGVLFILTEN